MDYPARPKPTNWNAWGGAAIALLLLFAAWQGARLIGLLSDKETVDQAWFDHYSDRFISPATQVTVNGKANKRMFPTAQGTQVIGYYPNGSKLKGRWVRGADPRILWFKTSDGYYLWEGNLVGDAAVMAAASQAALDPAKGPDLAPARAAKAAQPPTQPQPAPSASPSPAEARPSQGFDRRTLGLIGQALRDAGLASEMAANAELVTPPETGGGTSLTWSMCAERCNYDYSSAVITSTARGRSRVQACLHDGRRMAGWSEWYENGHPPERRPGLCPSSLAGIP